MNSIATRLLVSTSLVLAGFVILTSLAVRHSVHTRAEQALYDRMQGLIYGILGASELDDADQLRVNNFELPDQRLTSPVAGTYAEVRKQDGQVLWSSTSSAAFIPPTAKPVIGDWKFSLHSRRVEDAREDTEVRSLQFTVNWPTRDGDENIFILQAVNDATEFNSQLKNFDRTLWVSLSLAALMLLLIQLLVLTWGLNPLSRLGVGLKKIENGEAELLDDKLPIELRPLANGMNTLLQSERNRHQRFRHVIDDLAHSLKTPVSVIQNCAERQDDRQALPGIVMEQTARMQDIVAYHLQRASAQGTQALAAPVALNPIVQRLQASLSKVYRDQEITFNSTLPKSFKVKVNPADLMEMFGNILENSCKYGASVVRVSQAGQWIHIDDNGPGFPPGQIAELSKRGIRADEHQEGQGLGLAMAAELCQSYGGELKLNNRVARKEGEKTQRKGARVSLRLPV